jgi:hypothetical protein
MTSMSNRYAIVLDGTVINLATWDGESDWSPPEGEAVQCGREVGIGWTYEDGEFSPAEVEPERKLIPKSVIVQRLIDAGKIEAADTALESDKAAKARWNAADHPAIWSDDPEALALLQAIGADPAVIMA